MSWIKQFWLKNGQKTLATALGSIAVIDLTPYSDDFQDLIGGKHWHAIFRLIGAAGIIWRAIQAK